jgi:hypothetical protein
MLWNALKVGGFTIYVLLLCSAISVGIIIDRVVYYKRRSRVKRADFMAAVKEELARRGVESAKALCEQTFAPFANVVLAGLKAKGAGEKEI